MLAEAVFEVGCYVCVVPILLFDYVEIPHIIFVE